MTEDRIGKLGDKTIEFTPKEKLTEHCEPIEQ